MPPKSFDCDLVGPPDKVTNLRPVRIHIPENESELRAELRRLRQDTHEWSHNFWSEHNTQFKEKREAHVQRVLRGRSDAEKEAAETSTVTSDEMSEFYRDFLNNQRKAHLAYNLEWQKRNAKIVWLSLKVAVEDFFTEKKK